MKVQRQVQLFLQEGTSDKVYEIDLCEVSAGAFVVNFRYGRRGTALRDGTKTVLTVDLAKAEKIFDSLLAEKRGKGYREAGEPAAAGTKTARRKITVDPSEVNRKANEVVLRRFDQRLDADELDRLIWRCGERRLTGALPRLLALLPRAKGRQRRFSLAWAFGRIGDRAALPALEELCRDADPPTASIAAHARLFLLEPEEREREVVARRATWPKNLLRALDDGQDELAASALEAWIAATSWESLLELYLADDLPAERRLLLLFAAGMPLGPPAFRAFRRLFKAAELRCDGELFALLVRRLDKEKAAFRASSWSTIVYLGGQRVKIADELKKNDARIGYTQKSRTFLRLRAQRTLRKLGELKDSAFVPMAVSMLLAFSDEDAGKPRELYFMDRKTGRTQTLVVDPFLVYGSLAFLLYRKSPRFEQDKKGVWRYQANYRPGRPAPLTREEAFPEIWDAAPDALFHLLENSRCAPVHEFAAKALGENRPFCAELQIDQLVTLLAAPYEPTWQLGARLAAERWQSGPSIELLLAALASAGGAARAQALAWLAADPRYFALPEVAAGMLFSPFSEVRRTLIDRWRVAPPAGTTEAWQLLQDVLQGLLHLEAGSENAGERAADAASAILIGFPTHLRELDADLVGRLLGHPMAEVQQLGGRIVAEYLPIERITSEVVARLLAAESPLVRAQGVAVLGRLPLSEMPDAEEVLLAFCVAKESEIRQAARFPVRNLQTQVPAAASRLATALAARLLRADRPAGIHQDLLPIVLEDLAPSLASLGRDMALRLLAAPGSAAQQVGFAVLNQLEAWPTLSVREQARLAQHEMADVRERAWLELEADPARVRAAATDLIPALDGSWAESRERGQRYFEERFAAGDFDPVLLVALCDAVTPEARSFGREMLRRHFDSAEAETYLLRLAQHPSPDVQLFASGLLETHARGKPQLLAQLMPFCGRVLSRVYQGRAAKSRVLAFLHREALASEEAARLVLPLLETYSATVAIGDRASCLLALRDIQLAFPALPGLLSFQAIEERAG